MHRILETFDERFEVLHPLPEPLDLVRRLGGPTRLLKPADALSQVHSSTVAPARR